MLKYFLSSTNEIYSERNIQKLEDMLWACTLEFDGNWDDHLALLEFTYNIYDHSNIKMPPYEALYGRKFHTPSYWSEAVEKHFVCLEIVQQTVDKLKVSENYLRKNDICSNHHKSYSTK